jgi:hypothetical protein
MYWEPKACPAAAIYKGTMFSVGFVFRIPTEREVNDTACLCPRMRRKGCDALDDVFSGTDLPTKCKNLCKDEPQASKVEAFCKEVNTALERDFYQKVITRLVLKKGFDMKLLSTFHELCYVLCYRTDLIDLRTNHALKAASAALLANGKVSTLLSCNTSSSVLTLHHTTNPNVFVSAYDSALPLRSKYATALRSHKLNEIVTRTNTALKTLSEQVQH